MYAVFEDGSRQYKVGEGEVVKVDFRDLEPGAGVEFNTYLKLAPTGPNAATAKALADQIKK